MSPADVRTAAEVEALAARVLGRRDRPLVLVSTDAEGLFHFDLSRLRTELDGIADVVTIETGSASRDLEHLLPPKTHVFGGAGRSYPPDFGDAPEWARSPLRFPGHADADDLIDDAMGQTGRRTVESAPTASIRRASGIVQGFVADGTVAIVRLDDGTTVTATGALLPPEIPLIAALVEGGPVSGILDELELHPEPLAPDLLALVDGAHTLALVVKVTDLRATVQLHPRVSVVLRRRDVDIDEGPVSDVLHVGDVIRVRVRRDGDAEIGLSCVDVDPDAALTPPLALVAGGAPWLSEGRSSAASARDAAAPAGSDAPVPASETSGPSGSSGSSGSSVSPGSSGEDLATRHDLNALSSEVAAARRDILALTNLVARGGRSAPEASELEQLRAENDQLRASLADERAERAKVEARLADASQDRREAGRALRDARRAAERAHVDPTADGIRIEIERTWGNRTAPGERERWPLREFSFGPAFIDSLDALDENQLSKAVRACVDAITGRDREIPARELHRLRSGEGGDDPYVVRSDGARCWRSSIEQNAPGARRLHYWELAGGVIELSRVVHHDDTRP
ncbi:hypothetical protein MZK47_15655 [Microbacterium aerolatum]|uniref:hypothetical protein n=1 Tax=Microbacterium aerolatum TaxID=153731 RepID=UPI00200099AF|nr:hypothetical protein [Microbacterium aerolatum]MCK3771104.1 hypothetical protein [Microbacterium aerolatum]